MSKGLSYFLGILTGILLTIGFLAIKNATTKDGEAGTETTEKAPKLPEGVTMLDTPLPFTEARNFEIMQVIFNDAALAKSEDRRYGTNFYSDPIVLIVSDTENAFYDDQIVKAPKNSKVMQVGTYKYETKMGWKTVPIIRIINE